MTPTSARIEADAERIAARARRHYRADWVRILPDNTVAVMVDLIFTRAVMMDFDGNIGADRFCFEDRDAAVQWFSRIQSCDDIPTGHKAERRGLRGPRR